METLNRSTDISRPDAELLAFWLGLPAAFRYMIVVGTILGAGWTARGTFSEWMGVENRVGVLEKQWSDIMLTGKRQDAMLLYLMCRATEIDAQRSPIPCQHYVREFPEILSMLTGIPTK